LQKQARDAAGDCLDHVVLEIIFYYAVLQPEDSRAYAVQGNRKDIPEHTHPEQLFCTEPHFFVLFYLL